MTRGSETTDARGEKTTRLDPHSVAEERSPGYGELSRSSQVAIAIALLTALAFAPTLGNGFVPWMDDAVNILDNAHFRGLGLPQFVWAWQNHTLGVYQPLAWIILSGESALWDLHPWGYHLASIFLHATNAALFFLLTTKLLERARPDFRTADRLFGAALAAAVFALHPLRVEAVAWVSCQPYLPCALFSLLSLLVYLKASDGASHHRLYLLGSLLLFMAAVLCKAVAVTLPAVMLILDVYPLRRVGGSRGYFSDRSVRGVWLEKIAFFAVSAAFAVLALLARRWEYGPDYRYLSLDWRLSQAVSGICFYPMKTIFPVALLPVYPTPTRASLTSLNYMRYAAAVLIVSTALILLRKKWPAPLAAWASYLVVIAPNLGLFRFSLVNSADRYSYVATMAGFVLVAGTIAALRPLSRSLSLAVVSAGLSLALIAALVPLTWRQCMVWHDADALWKHAETVCRDAVQAHPDAADLHQHLGYILFHQERLNPAADEFRDALSLNPNASEAHCYLGQILAKRGQLDDAIAELRKAVLLDPTFADYHFGLGTLLIAQNRINEGTVELTEALRLNPYYHDAEAVLRALRESAGQTGDRIP